MDRKRRPQTCKWAEPTLHQAWPLWLDAWSWPWACRADGVPKLLPTTTECEDCYRWEPHAWGTSASVCTGFTRMRRSGPA
jgi:hypothetical protein